MVQSPGVYRFIIKSVYAKIAANLSEGEQKLREIAKHSGISYSHLSIVMQAIHKEGLIDRKPNKHGFDITLTPKGEEFSKLMVGVKMVIENWDEDVPCKLNKLFSIEKVATEPTITEPEQGPAPGVITPANPGGN